MDKAFCNVKKTVQAQKYLNKLTKLANQEPLVNEINKVINLRVDK